MTNLDDARITLNNVWANPERRDAGPRALCVIATFLDALLPEVARIANALEPVKEDPGVCGDEAYCADWFEVCVLPEGHDGPHENDEGTRTWLDQCEEVYERGGEVLARCTKRSGHSEDHW